MPVQIAQLSGNDPLPAPPVTPRVRLPITPPDVVETILGDKRTTKSF
jgi:hypothetical protein